MDEFIKIRIEELKVLRENVIQKQREELAKIDVRIDELKSMLSSEVDYSSDEKIDLDTVNKVATVLKEEKENNLPQEKKEKENIADDFEIDIEEESNQKTINSEEVDLEAMLNDL